MVSPTRKRIRAQLTKSCIPPPTLSVRQFAERHVRLPKTSPFGNVRFRCDRQPVAGLLFDELDSGHWKTIVVAGPSQSGKTLSAFVIPMLRDVMELGLNTIAAVPVAEMMADKWDADFLPTLSDSPELRQLIPRTGPGSRGGRIKDRISLGNGADIKIMSRGGDDTARAGYTSPRVYATEAAGWSDTSDTSVEANKLRQLTARMKAFKRTDERRCLLVEGTLTIAEELPYSARGDDDDERLISSRSRLLSPCPHCGVWILPERVHLVGWENAESEDQAANESTWICPACEHAITNEERRESLADVRLVHWGQEITPSGEVIGPKPPTSTLWFHWQAWHNLLRDADDFGVALWEQHQLEEGTEEHENAEKELSQFDFSTPFVPTLSTNEPLKAHVIRKRTGQWQRNLLPPDTVKFTLGVDLGDWTGWWFGIAWRACGLYYVPAYGAFDVKRSKADDLSTRVKAALHDFADSIVEVGFAQEGSDGLWIPDEVWIDGGYLPDDVAEFISQRGTYRDNIYKKSVGRGESTRGGSYKHPLKLSQKHPRIGRQWYMSPNHKRKIPEYTFNADFWKLFVARALRVELGKRGSLTLFRGDLKNEHAKVTNHLANEQLKRDWVPGKGLVDHWVVTGDQHWNDAAAMASAAGDSAGFSLAGCAVDEHEATTTAKESADDPARSQNDRASWYHSMLAGFK